ncbi:MAG: PH domain-containing protein [Patescibacteria group bacterium]|nr:PH domain-containing protein [Patescibacteria group bacterium]
MEKLDPKAIWIFFFRFLGAGLFLTLMLGWGFLSILVEFEISFNWWIAIILAIVWLCGSYIWAKLSYNNYKFEIGEEIFKKEQGVIWKKYISIPYDRIQNIDIHRGVLTRILGLSDLMIQTAGYAGGHQGRGFGGKEPEGRLPAVSQRRAEEIREALIKKAKGLRQGI